MPFFQYDATRLREAMTVPIKLNVGGFSFQTRASTLLQQSRVYMKHAGVVSVADALDQCSTMDELTSRLGLLGVMTLAKLDSLGLLVSQKGCGSGQQGNEAVEPTLDFFLDRDATHFRLILNFLRDGTAELPKDGSSLRELLTEAKFFRVFPLVTKVEEQLGHLGEAPQGQCSNSSESGKQCLHESCRRAAKERRGSLFDIEDIVEEARKPLGLKSQDGWVHLHSDGSGSSGGEALPRKNASSSRNSSNSSVLAVAEVHHCPESRASTPVGEKGVQIIVSSTSPTNTNLNSPVLLRTTTTTTTEVKGCPLEAAGQPCKCLSATHAKPFAHSADTLTVADVTSPASSISRVSSVEKPLTAPKLLAEPEKYIPYLKLHPNPSKNFITLDEIKMHNKPDDCWLVVKGKVYDVTSFIQWHPAGAEAIYRHAGQDCSIDFSFHSGAAQKMWAKLYIGRVKEADRQCHVM